MRTSVLDGGWSRTSTVASAAWHAALSTRRLTRWTADQVHAALVDPTYLRDRLSTLGGTDASLLDHQVNGEKVSLRLRQGVPATELPSAVRRSSRATW